MTDAEIQERLNRLAEDAVDAGTTRLESISLGETFDGCARCVTREVLLAAWPAMIEIFLLMAERNGVHTVAMPNAGEIAWH